MPAALALKAAGSPWRLGCRPGVADPWRREAEADSALPAEAFVVVLNFSGHDVSTWIRWPKASRWEEQIDKATSPQPPLQIPAEGHVSPVQVPSNYGAVYQHKP